MYLGSRNPRKVKNMDINKLSSSESSYRRGFTQALNMAADLVQAGCSQHDLNWLVNESLRMRNDRKPHPAFLDELLSRYHIRGVGDG